MSGAAAETAQIGGALPTERAEPAALAVLIHDDVLQSLGVAVLSVDLCRRLHERFRYEQALDELTGMVQAIGAAHDSTAQLLPQLHQVLPSRPSPSARPSLVVLAGAPGLPASHSHGGDRPAAGAAEIFETLAACELQARRCRHQYDAGLGEDTLRDLELLLQRLEFVTTAFRQVLGELRQQAARPLPAASWARTA